MGLVSPTSHQDPDNRWADEERAYDNDINYGTGASTTLGGAGIWCSYFELEHSEITCDAVRWHWNQTAFELSVVGADIYYSSDWHNVYEGAPSHSGSSYDDFSFSSQAITAFRIRGKVVSQPYLVCSEAYFNEAAPAGWSHKYLGVANAAIGKISGVAIADIVKVNGVA